MRAPYINGLNCHFWPIPLSRGNKKMLLDYTERSSTPPNRTSTSFAIVYRIQRTDRPKEGSIPTSGPLWQQTENRAILNARRDRDWTGFRPNYLYTAEWTQQSSWTVTVSEDKIPGAITVWLLLGCHFPSRHDSMSIPYHWRLHTWTACKQLT